jgi:hypothetical protein
MNIDETIDAFRRGVLDLDCKRIVLSQNREGGERFEGPGYVRQAEDGTLEFKLYAVKLENVRPLGHLEALSKGVAGQLRADDSFYALTAVGRDGTSLTADRILPNPHWDMSDHSVLVTGKMQSMVACLELPQPHHYLRLHFFEEYDVPLRLMSKVEIHGSEYMVRDRAEFNAQGAEFEVRKREDSGDTVVEVTSQEAFPPAFDLRIQEALQYITGRTAIWRVKLASGRDRLLLELASPWRKSVGAKLNPPIVSASIDFQQHGWQLFTCYLAYVIANTHDTHWNPVAYHLYNACESSANSLDAWAVGVSVAVEAVVDLIQLQGDDQKAERLKLFQQRMLEWLAAQTDFSDFLDRMRGLIGMMGRRRPQDTLYGLADTGFAERAYVDAWTYLRNRHVHPTIKDLKKPDLSDYQKLYDNIHRVEVLLHQLTFYLIGYKGPFTDYGTANFPSKQYPLTEGAVAAEAPAESNLSRLGGFAQMICGWFG